MLPYLLLVLLILGLIIALVRLRSLRRPRAFPSWAAWLLDSSARRLFFRRSRVIESARIEPGMRVLEIGSGNGYVSESVAETIGRDGSLVCLDIQPAMLSKVRSRRIDPAPVLVCASADSLPFQDRYFDLVLMVCVLGETPDKVAVFRACKRVLRSGGTLAITEALPDPDYVRARVMRSIAASAGFEPGNRLGNVIQSTHCFTRR